MKCPKCNTEMIIGVTGYVLKDGVFCKKMPYICRNKDCTNYNKVVKTEYLHLDVTEEGNSAE